MSDTISYSDIAKRVVRAFRKSQREMPWRNSSDPYAIWISEVMLQQTRVAAVIPYYERWLRDFPTIHQLASASLDEVLSHWSGLGYYSRARNIHRCAQEVERAHGGKLPKTAAELRALPGIGRYTAGAISSIAHGQREPLVDGNVARLLARVFLIEESIKSTAVTNQLWKICTEMVPESAPGDFNQGLMELGATVCLPKNPKCTTCPLRSLCRARDARRTSSIPVVPRRASASDKPLLASDAALVLRRHRLLLAQRKPEGLFGGLWELPQAATRNQLSELTGLTLTFEHQEPSMVHNQVLTHRRLSIRVWPAAVSGRTKLASGTAYSTLAWHRPAELTKLGISTATREILERRPETQHG